MSVSDPEEKIEWGADSELRKNERVPSSGVCLAWIFLISEISRGRFASIFASSWISRVCFASIFKIFGISQVRFTLIFKKCEDRSFVSISLTLLHHPTPMTFIHICTCAGTLIFRPQKESNRWHKNNLGRYGKRQAPALSSSFLYEEIDFSEGKL